MEHSENHEELIKDRGGIVSEREAHGGSKNLCLRSYMNDPEGTEAYLDLRVLHVQRSSQSDIRQLVGEW